AVGSAARTVVKVRSMRGRGRSCCWAVMSTPHLLRLPPVYRAVADRTWQRACFVHYRSLVGDGHTALTSVTSTDQALPTARTGRSPVDSSRLNISASLR